MPTPKDDVYITQELACRPARSPDYQAQSHALTKLAQAMARCPRDVPRQLVELALELCRADSAGIGILEVGAGRRMFRWHAVAGRLAARPGDLTACPAGLDGGSIFHDGVHLLKSAELDPAALRVPEAAMGECLIAPCHFDGRPVGFITAVVHSPGQHFDAEDARLLCSLAPFASAAHWMTVVPGAGHDGSAPVASKTQLAAIPTGMKQLHGPHARLSDETALYAALDEIVAAACQFTGTDRGYLQLVSADGEHIDIAAQRGYLPDSPFIHHCRHEVFAQGHAAGPAEQRRLSIEDTASYPGLAGNAAGAAALDEGIRAAQATPIVSREGRLLGMLSTQFRQPRLPAAESLQLIDLLAWTAGEFIERYRAEASLRESEKRFRALSSATADVIYRMSPDWTQMRQLDGRGFLKDTSQPYQSWADEYIPPEDRELVSSAIAEAIRNKTMFQLEHRVRRIDGSYGWTFSRAVPMLDAHGAIYEWIGAASDITERKQAEARYRTLFVSIDEGFCVIDMLFDADHRPCDYRFCEVNPAFEAHTGLRDVMGRTVRELNPLHEQFWFDTYAEVLRSGQPKRFESSSESLDRYFDVYAFRIADGDTPKVAVLLKDISAHRQAVRRGMESEQQAIVAARRAEEAHRRLDALLQAAPVGIVMSDTKGGVILANAEHKRLWGGEPPLPKHMAEFADWKAWWADGTERHGRSLAADEWATVRVLHGENVQHDTIEIQSFGLPAVRRTILVSGAAIQSDSGQIIGAAVVEMDITDRIKAEAALRAADRRKDEFLAMLAHELRNPLAPISAAADLLAMTDLEAAMVRQTSVVISRQVRHMAGLVDDLLDVSRVTRGLVRIRRDRLDIRQVACEAVEQVQPLLEARGHRMTIHAPPQAALVSGDRNRLVQVVANLLNNAAKYTPRGGNIQVDIEVGNATVDIHVTDDGIGMAPDLIDHAFELFTQAERTSDRSQGGLGIGLALVRSLVTLHGGRVVAHSDGAGKGSRFTVTLGRAREGLAGASGGPGLSPVVQTVRLKVLIVDDNQDAAAMEAMVVEALGHEVMVEHGAREALQRAAAECPQVCLLDIGLPDMDGNELARRLRRQPETAASVLIAVTGYGQEHDRAISRAAGFDYHFVKPMDAIQLADLLAWVGAAAKAN